MSYQVGSACYETTIQAASASASAQVGSLVQISGAPHVAALSGNTGSVLEWTFVPVVGGPSVVVSAPYTAQPCGLLQASDAVSMSWMVVAVWLAAYSLLFIARAVRGETEGNYGNA